MLFFSGLLGWVGGTSASPCLVRLFLLTLAVSIVGEIGGIIALNIIRLKVISALEKGKVSKRVISPFELIENYFRSVL